MSPYRPTGRTSVSDLLWLLLAMLVSGLIAGALASFIGQYFRIVLLFPIAMGILVGLAGVLAIHWRRFQMPLVAALLGLLGGLTAFSTDHLVDYVRHRQLIKAEMIRVVDRLGGDAEAVRSHPRLAAAIDQTMIAAGRGDGINVINILALLGNESLDSDPTIGPAAALRGWLAARRDAGVSISRAGSSLTDETGAFGGLIFWAVSAMLCGGAASWISAKAAREPVCAGCRDWFADSTDHLPVANYGFNESVCEALEQHDAKELARVFPKLGLRQKYLALEFRRCPNCQDGPVYAQMLRVTSHRGRLSKSRITHGLMPAQDAQKIAVALKAAHRHQREEAIRNVVRPKHRQ